MGRRVRRVPVNLNIDDLRPVPFDEIKVILRGADPIIMSGRRTLLAKILKGSRESKVLELNLDRCPVYGYFKDLSIKAITTKIDWLILSYYLEIQYDYRLPLLVYTRKGWEIEMDTYSDELLRGFDELIASGKTEFDMTYLKDRNREMIFMLLEKIAATKDKKYIPILEAWKEIDYKKVRQRINWVITKLQRE
ncbi:MAG: RQC-minor-1 family DNA-binding protein [candidate division KSB1 bacterium]|nr:RQC-minor-1 family DNA-binding protein [candidate division KSB1 bacterium]